jgi:enamine deaminase RidA (YjgF/YER057c/UK114 family)
VVHFLAGNGRVTPIENPLQVSAYRYPTQYGPRSPSFSRAVIHESATGRQFLISGTSSILGHETIAPHDPLTQTRITLDNLEALLQAANYPRLAALGQKASWCVYLRNPSDLDTVRPLIDARLPRDAEVIYLEGDICRRDLVIEIEGTLLC